MPTFPTPTGSPLSVFRIRRLELEKALLKSFHLFDGLRHALSDIPDYGDQVVVGGHQLG